MKTEHKLILMICFLSIFGVVTFQYSESLYRNFIANNDMTQKLATYEFDVLIFKLKSILNCLNAFVGLMILFGLILIVPGQNWRVGILAILYSMVGCIYVQYYFWQTNDHISSLKYYAIRLLNK